MAKKILIIIIGILLLTLIGIFKGGVHGTSVKSVAVTETAIGAVGEVPADWKSYTSSALRLSLRYPPTYVITESDGVLSVQSDATFVPSITITRTAGLPSQVWSARALETHRVARKNPADPSFIVTSFSTGDPSTVRRYILFPKSFPESLTDTGEGAEGLLIDMLGGDSRDPKDNLTATLEKVIFSLEDQEPAQNLTAKYKEN